MDYSGVYRENELLESNLQDHLGSITWNERKIMAEKGEELYEMRRELEEITKLQSAVNSRQPGESSEVVTKTRSHRKERGSDAADLTKAARFRLRIEAERDKFSAKNLFNVRRVNNFMGFEMISSKKLLPSSAMQVPSEDEDEIDPDFSTKEETVPVEQQTLQSTNNNFKEILSNHPGLRPMTAGAGCLNEKKHDVQLPSRSKSAVSRSRSRRELQLLSTLSLEKHVPAVNSDFQVDWSAIHKKRERMILQQLKLENKELQARVQSFLRNLEQFNKRHHSTRSTKIVHSSRTTTALDSKKTHTADVT